MNAIQKPDPVQIARTAVREFYAGAPVAGISVLPDVDFEGAPVLRIGIVMEGESIEPFSGYGLADALLHVRRRLWDAGIEDFPMITFFTQQDAIERQLEAV